MKLLNKTIIFALLCSWALIGISKPYSEEIHNIFVKAAKNEIILTHFEVFSPNLISNEIQVVVYDDKSTPTIIVYNDSKETIKLENSFLQTFSSVTGLESLGGKDFALAFIINNGVHGQKLIIVDPVSGEILFEKASDWGIKLNSNERKLWFLSSQDGEELTVEWPSH